MTTNSYTLKLTGIATSLQSRNVCHLSATGGMSGLQMRRGQASAWRQEQLTAGSNFLPPASRKGAVMTTDSRALSPIIVASQLEPSDCSSSSVRLPMAYSGAPWLAIVTHSKRIESCTHGQ